METLKLRMRIGVHEFEAEGPSEIVTGQFEQWKALIESAKDVGFGGKADSPLGSQSSVGGQGGTSSDGLPVLQLGTDISTDQLVHVFDRDKHENVILRIPLAGSNRHGDAILVTLYGFRRLLSQDEVTALRLMNSLTASGAAPPRLDRPAAPYVREQLLIQRGAGRARRYRLTNRGMVRAEEIIRPLLEQVA